MKKLSELIEIVSYTVFSFGTTVALFLMHVFVARQLGPANYGIIVFATALSASFEPMLDAGMHQYNVREMSRDDSVIGRLVSTAFIWKLLSFPLLISLVLTITVAIHGPDHTMILAVGLIAASLLFVSFREAFRPIAISMEKFRVDAILVGFPRLVSFVIVSLVVLFRPDVVLVCTTFLAISFTMLLLTAFWFKTQTDIQFLQTVKLTQVFSTVRTTYPIALLYLGIYVYNYVDTIMLSAISGNSSVGWYGAAYKLYEGFLILPVSIATFYAPRLAKAAMLDNRLPLAKSGRHGMLIASTAAGLVAGNGILFSKIVIDLFFGPDYESSVTVLEILMIGIPAAFVITYLHTFLIAIHLEKTLAALYAVGLVINIGINGWLIPRYSHVGAAIATVIVEYLLVVTLLHLLQRRRANIGAIVILMRSAIPCMIAAYFLNAYLSQSNFIINALIANATFAFVLTITGVTHELVKD